MDILDSFTAVIYNTDDLASAVSAAYNFNLIYFGANITLSRGVAINPAKTALTFDGQYLGNSYSFTDMNSTAAANTLYVWTSSNIAITIRNLTITGRNYYGVPYIREEIGVNNSGVSVTYENVHYSGIQIAYCPEGMVVFNDCEITITPPAGSTTAQEVGEVCRVEFAGTNIIAHHSTTDAVFWFRGVNYGPVLRLRPGAHVTITTDNYFMYNLIPRDLPLIQNPVLYELLEGSTLLLNSNRGISFNSDHRVLSFHAAAGATLHYIQRATNGNFESLYINGAFNAEEDSTVYMQASYTGARPLLHFMNNAALNVTSPRSFVLYNSVGPALIVNTGVTRSFVFQCNQLNRWLTATPFPAAGTFDDDNRPQWRKPNWSLFTVSGSITPTATSNISSSFTQDELNDLPDLTTLSLHSAHVIALGNLPITMNPIINDGRAITGWSSPGAIIRIVYNVGGTDYLIELTADSDGYFASSETDPIPVGTIVTVQANTPFLITFVTHGVINAGDLYIERAPEIIRFIIDPIVRVPSVILPREDPADAVVVVDNRGDESRWALLLAIDGPIRTTEGDTIESGLIFTNDSGTIVLNGNASIVYIVGSGQSPFTISWPREQGVLLEVTEPIRVGLPYTATLNWSLQILED